MANTSVSQRFSVPIESQYTEIVERKGIGHPDSLIDGIMEKVSVELSKTYLEKFGTILHHNVDKGLIVGGTSDATFGSGKIITPIEVILAGRATREYNNSIIDVDNIAVNAARSYLQEHTRFLDLDNEVKFQSKILKGSSDLNHIFARGNGVPLSNDTSFGVGFAPLSETERIVLETERFLNGSYYKQRMPAIGEDIKVMGVRDGDNITLTVAIAFVAHLVKDKEEYASMKSKVASDIRKEVSRLTSRDVFVVINNGDSYEQNSFYLTKSGLSCESGDDGSVGRGNRINGLITPFRHMTLEAAAGKNPVNHVGKIYNIVASEAASGIIKEYPQVRECYIFMVSQIGRPIDDPKSMHVEVLLDAGEKISNVSSGIKYTADSYLENLDKISEQIVLGKYPVF
ncbi:MAG: methionine adenosyltransferase [Candidatus Micrarchaeia archaeon]